MSDDSDFDSRVCPVYALQPIKIFGLSSGGLVIVLICVMIINPFLGLGWAMGVGLSLAVGVEAAAKKAKIPGGYLQYKLSVLAGGPFIKRHAPGFSKSIAMVWQSSGSLAPPGYRSQYRP